METRKCSRCKKELSVDNFSINPKTGKLYTQCNICIEYGKSYYKANKEKIAEYMKSYREANKEYMKSYREANKEKIAEQNKFYYEANKEKIAEQMKSYREANKEKISEHMKSYREANKEYFKSYYEANKEKIAERKKSYYEANKEKIAEHMKSYRETNKEKIAEYMKSYREANKEKIVEQNKSYYEANKEKIAEYMKSYYEANKEYLKSYYEANKDKIAERDKSYYEANKEKIAEKMKSYRKAKALYKTYKDSFFGEFKEGENGVLLVKCKYCNKWFSPTNSEVVRYIQQDTSLYCSNGCKKSCPTYRVQKHEKGFRQNTSREVQPQLRKLVLERDNWTCQKCGANKDEDITVTLHCHHIDPVKNNPIESADMDNCVTLCKACHKEVHKQKGCRPSDLANCKIKD